MGTIKQFEDTEAWQKARIIANKVYQVTLTGTFGRDYELRDHINKASGSIMDNIAEGDERDGRNEFKQFLSIAKGSAGEVKSQLYRALDRNHINQQKFDALYNMVNEVAKMIRGLINYLRTTDYKGTKFNESEEKFQT